jgi:hypothetical protein
MINDSDPQFITTGPIATIGELHDALVEIMKWGVKRDTNIVFSIADGNDTVLIDLTDATDPTYKRVWFI